MAAQDRFIALWGDMGAHWGVPRTMAEIHALLFIAGEAMNTDQIMARLHISRGNASMTLRTLVEWGMVTRSHQRSDRKDYFHAEQDVWKLLATVLRARKRRELDPLLTSLRGCLLDDARRGDDAAEHDRRIGDLITLIETLDRLSEHLLGSNAGGDKLADLAHDLSEDGR